VRYHHLMLTTFAALAIGCSGSDNHDPKGKSPAVPTGEDDDTVDSGTAHTGSLADTAVERLEARYVAGPQQLDVLLVVDNSCSMEPHQVALADQFPQVLDDLQASGIDYHVGVTSTDVDPTGSCAGQDPSLSGQLSSFREHRWVDASTANAARVFGGLTKIGTRGSHCEKGLAATYRALEQQSKANAGFRRPTAALHTIILSDEDDQSEDDSPPVVTLDEFIDWFDTMPPGSGFHTLTCIQIVPLNDAGPSCPSQSSIGYRYHDVRDAVGGIGSDILEPFPMGRLSDAIRDRGPIDIALDVPADPASLVVTAERVDSGAVEDLAKHVVYDEATQTVTVSGVLLAEGDEVVVSYMAL